MHEDISLHHHEPYLSGVISKMPLLSLARFKWLHGKSFCTLKRPARDCYMYMCLDNAEA